MILIIIQDDDHDEIRGRFEMIIRITIMVTDMGIM